MYLSRVKLEDQALNSNESSNTDTINTTGAVSSNTTINLVLVQVVLASLSTMIFAASILRGDSRDDLEGNQLMISRQSWTGMSHFLLFSYLNVVNDLIINQNRTFNEVVAQFFFGSDDSIFLDGHNLNQYGEGIGGAESLPDNENSIDDSNDKKESLASFTISEYASGGLIFDHNSRSRSVSGFDSSGLHDTGHDTVMSTNSTINAQRISLPAVDGQRINRRRRTDTSTSMSTTSSMPGTRRSLPTIDVQGVKRRGRL